MHFEEESISHGPEDDRSWKGIHQGDCALSICIQGDGVRHGTFQYEFEVKLGRTWVLPRRSETAPLTRN